MTPQALAAVRVRLAAMHAANFSGLGFYLPFFPIWLTGIGLGEGAIGIVLAAPMLVRMLVAPWISGLADRHLQPGTLLALLNGIVMAGYLVLWPLQGFWPVLIVITALSLGLSAIVPVADALTNAHVLRGGGIDYGRVRVWGSVSFLAANLAGGLILNVAGAGVVPLVLAACAGLAVLTALLSPRLPGSPADRARVADIPVAPARPAQRAAFRCMLAASALVQASHGALYGFGTLYWQASGTGDVMIGVLWAVGVAAEIVLFAVAGRVPGRGFAGLGWIATGAAVAAIRFSVMAFAPGLVPALLLQLLHAASFGLTHLGAMAAITVLAPPEARGKAQGQLTAIHAIATSAATVMAGFLYGRIGGLTFLAMVPLAAAGLGFALAAGRLAVRDAARGATDGNKTGG